MPLFRKNTKRINNHNPAVFKKRQGFLVYLKTTRLTSGFQIYNQRQGFFPASVLSLIIELQIVDVHSVSVLDAHFLQPGEQAAFAQLLVEIVP